MMNAAKVYRFMEGGLEERNMVSRAHLHLKRHAIKQLAVDRAIFDRRHFNQTILQIFHYDPK